MVKKLQLASRTQTEETLVGENCRVLKLDAVQQQSFMVDKKFVIIKSCKNCLQQGLVNKLVTILLNGGCTNVFSRQSYTNTKCKDNPHLIKRFNIFSKFRFTNTRCAIWDALYNKLSVVQLPETTVDLIFQAGVNVTSLLQVTGLSTRPTARPH